MSGTKSNPTKEHLMNSAWLCAKIFGGIDLDMRELSRAYDESQESPSYLTAVEREMEEAKAKERKYRII